jgi:retron-type reverse transcriptase
MQRVGNLFPLICSFPNLLLAWKKAKRGTKPNQENLSFSFHLEQELLQLQSELLSETYKPKPYRYFMINDPKERTISIASFRDRVVHHAIVNVLEPIFERRFIFHSYATRKGKGTHLAIKKAQDFLRKSEWFYKADISKYFDSVDHNILMGIIGRKIKDKKLLQLIDKIIRNSNATGKGIPIGNLSSQFFANVYLDRFDHYVTEFIRPDGYIRYMDDFVLFGHDKNFLKASESRMSYYLSTELKLQLKPGACMLNKRSNGLTFLGKRIFSGTIRFQHDHLQRILRRIKQREKEFEHGNTDHQLILNSLNSYWANLSYFNTFSLRRTLIEKGYLAKMAPTG